MPQIEEGPRTSIPWQSSTFPFSPLEEIRTGVNNRVVIPYMDNARVENQKAAFMCFLIHGPLI